MDNEEFQDELEMLHGIFEDELKIINASTFKLQLHPDDVAPEKRYVGIEMKMAVSKAYPSEPAQVQLLKPKGLDQAHVTELETEALRAASEAAEDEMVAGYAIAQACQEYLTEHNIPDATCAICLELLSPEELVRTDCYHVFHNVCLSRHIQLVKADPIVELTAASRQRLIKTHSTDAAILAALKDEARALPVPCPICRAPILNDSLPLRHQLPEYRSAAKAVQTLSPAQRAAQAQRERIYQHQKEIGGLIDASGDTGNVVTLVTGGYVEPPPRVRAAEDDSDCKDDKPSQDNSQRNGRHRPRRQRGKPNKGRS
eukprot:TRINITY_DN9037_c0_g1_i2.p1 TRINITY_DN9037_c0_g1~~TRINITY_DN9037_c0_g1_i2.p1  ORF type:complete len:314 (+),score=57.04 TRINITY_DN9037_c0_g1_i2:88-1029(+)